MMERLLFEKELTLSLSASQILRKSLNKILVKITDDTSIKNKILLCLSETITNLNNHAKNANNIICHFGGNTTGWWLEIIDDGESWNPTKYETDDVVTHFSLTEDGRGIALLKTLCEHISYSKIKGKELNKLRLEWETEKTNSKTTILIVDDDRSLLRIYTHYLSNDFEVISTDNGKEALSLFNKHKIDLIMSDINMPEMSGISFREQLDNKMGTCLTPFIFLTAAKNDKTKKRASALGIDDYISKPASKDILINTIKRVIERSHQIYNQLTTRIEKNITSSLSPSIPNQSHDWRLCVASRNTGVGGGDILLHKNNEHNLQLVIADIMGHDECAKFFAHAYSGYLHGILHSYGNKKTNNIASELLEQLSNFSLQDKLFSQIMLTCCSLSLSKEGNVSIASAGHPPPMLIKKNNIEEVSVGGMLPGLQYDTHYQSKHLKLKQGERIAIYTDGLFESAADNITRKKLEKSIITSLLDTIDFPINKSLELTMGIFDTFNKKSPSDDTLLILLEPV